MTNGIPRPNIPQPGQVYDNVANVLDIVPNTIDTLINTVRGGALGLKNTVRTALRPPDFPGGP